MLTFSNSIPSFVLATGKWDWIYEHVNMFKIQNVWSLSDGKTSSTSSRYFNSLTNHSKVHFFLMLCCRPRYQIHRKITAAVISKKNFFTRIQEKIGSEAKILFLAFVHFCYLGLNIKQKLLTGQRLNSTPCRQSLQLLKTYLQTY